MHVSSCSTHIEPDQFHRKSNKNSGWMTAAATQTALAATAHTQQKRTSQPYRSAEAYLSLTRGMVYSFIQRLVYVPSQVTHLRQGVAGLHPFWHISQLLYNIQLHAGQQPIM